MSNVPSEHELSQMDASERASVRGEANKEMNKPCPVGYHHAEGEWVTRPYSKRADFVLTGKTVFKQEHDFEDTGTYTFQCKNCGLQCCY